MKGVVALNPEHRTERNALPSVGRYLLRARAHGDNPLSIAESEGESERVIRVLKAAIDPGTIDGGSMWGDELGSDMRVAQDGFIDSLRGPGGSVFFRLLNDGFTRVPLRTRLAIASAGATAFVRREGHVRPLTSMSFENSNGLELLEAVAVIIVTREVLKFMPPQAAALMDRELRAAVSDVVDQEFLAVVHAAASGLVASGVTLAAAIADLKALLGAVNVSQRSRLIWIGAPSVAKALASGLGEDATAFPAMSPTGGRLLNIDFMVSDQVTGGRLYLLDAATVAADAEGVRLETVEHADLQLESAPDSPGTASTVLHNLWQRNEAALTARVYFGLESFRTGGAAVLTGIDWGTPPDSPAA